MHVEENHETTLALSQIINSFDDAHISMRWFRPSFIILAISAIILIAWYMFGMRK